MLVLGIEVTLELTRPETGGDYYVFEASTPLGFGVPPHAHQHEDEIKRGEIWVKSHFLAFYLKCRLYFAGTKSNFPDDSS